MGYSSFHNGSRHIAERSGKLHEVFSSHGEIVYRRKDLSGDWETTQMISAGSGNSADPCLTIAHDGSVHVVWQRQLASTSFALWYNRSTDGGITWGIPDTIPGAGNVGILQDQWNIYPLIAERSTSQLVIVWCWGTIYTGNGLKYVTSTNLGQSWSTVQNITSPGSLTWFPSLASPSGGSNLMLTYDGRYNGVFSTVYNGTSWSSSTSVSNGTGINNSRHSSIAFDVDMGVTYTAWCGQPSGHNEYVIGFKTGNYNGTWGSQYVQFAVDSTGVSDYYPSISGWYYMDSHNVDIVYYSSINKVKLNQYSEAAGEWQTPRTLSTSGQWANMSLQGLPSTSTYPIRIWTDQAGSPYQLTLSSDGSYSLQMAQAPMVFHRRVVVESPSQGSVVYFDLAPLKIVTASNDTLVLPFRKIDFKKPFTATLANAWDYLSSDTLTLPANARTLLFNMDIQPYARQDSVGAKALNLFTSSSYELDVVTGGKVTSLLADQPGVSAQKQVSLTQQAGKNVQFRMVASIPAATKEDVSVGIGNVYQETER